MSAKHITRQSKVVRYENLDELPPAPPLSKEVNKTTDAEIERRAVLDPDAGHIPQGFWDKAEVVEPEGTRRI